MSVCLSCGNERDSCEICGGDLADAHAYAASLRARLEAAERECANADERWGALSEWASDMNDGYLMMKMVELEQSSPSSRVLVEREELERLRRVEQAVGVFLAARCAALSNSFGNLQERYKAAQDAEIKLSVAVSVAQQAALGKESNA